MPSLGFGSAVGIGNLCTDSKRAIYLAGAVSADGGTVHFDNYSFDAWNSNPRAIFLKYNGNGNVIWAKSTPYDATMGNSGVVTGSINTIDKFDDRIIIGSFKSNNIVFGTDTLWNHSMSNAEMFIVKYDASDNIIWHKVVFASGIANGVYGISVSTDNNGSIYITGNFVGFNAVFDNDTIWNCNQNAPYPDIFVVKYYSNGILAWVKHAGGPAEDGGTSTTVKNGEVYLTCNTLSPYVVFENDSIPGPSYIVKYDSSGNLKWVKKSKTNWASTDYIKSGKYKDLYFSGIYADYLSFDVDTLYGNQNSQSYICKMDTSGKVKWLKNTGIGNSFTNAMIFDDNGDLWNGGTFSDSIFICGNDTLINSSFATQYGDIYMAKFDTANGNAQYAMNFGGVGDEGLNSILVVKDSLYVTGNFGCSAISFGNTTFNLQLVGNYDWFFAKYILPPNGINDVPKENEVSIYPNPFTNIINIQKSLPKQETFSLYDSFGKLILSKTILENKEQINTSNLATGLYFYAIVNHNGERVKAGKVVKE